MTAIVSWLSDASREQKRTLLAASLGWMLDSMDVMLYALVLGEVQHELHLSAALSGAMVSATLIAAAAGGMGFGWFADRFGRTRALTLSILVYSISTALCGLTHSPGQLLVCRILVGLGMGGEWAAGAALVAETWPDRHRGKALALVQSSWAVGYAVGAIMAALVMPTFGWRAVFFVGVTPALIGLWLRRGLRESEAWQRQRSSRLELRPLLRGSIGRSVLICATMNAAALFAWWGLFTWVPRFLSMPRAEGGRGFSIVQTSVWIVAMQAGSFAGYIAFGYLADQFGRKRTYISYLLMAAALVPVFAFVHDPRVLLVIGPLVGFFGTGYFSGFSIITSELFPTSLRGTAMGFTYNIGRLASAAAPYAIGRFSERGGLGAALCLTSGAFLLAALIASMLQLPVTLGAVESGSG